MNPLRVIVASLTAMALICPGVANARSTLKDICRVKGQEENTLQGLGIVVGLKGTGDGGKFLPTLRSLSRAMELMGNPLGKQGLVELKDAKNVALVMVTATVPATGAQQGDKVDCIVNAIGAKSLAGGWLLSTPLQGPRTKDPRVYAFAGGAVDLDDLQSPATAKVHQGCRLEETFNNVFSKDGKVLLVIDEHHADFQVAQDVAEVINSQLRVQNRYGALAKALNAATVEVAMPPQYEEDPVLFLAQVMSLPMLEPRTAARVVINQKTGTVVIGGDVEIGAVAVTHKNIVVETGAPTAGGIFLPVDPNRTGSAKLQSLVEALNAIKVAPEDIIEIIKGVERNGKLHGTLIVE